MKDAKKKKGKRLKRLGKKLIYRINGFVGRHSLIPDQPFFDTKDFPWAAELEKHHEEIRKELDGVLRFQDKLPKLHELQKEQSRISADNKWKTFILSAWGYHFQESIKACPRTVELLKVVPGLRTAVFSILEAGAKIPEHRGLVKGLVRCHLALKVPKQSRDCVIRIAGEPHYWEQGRMMIFDDTYLHQVDNDTEEDRVVLLMHFDRPMDRAGRLVHRIMLALLRRSDYVKQAKRRHEEWEERFRGQG